MKVILYTNKDGVFVICVPTGELPIEDVIKKDIPAGCTPVVVEQSTLPKEHADFFGAWELHGEQVVVSLDKAKQITKQRLRIEREPLLQQQDVAFQRAQEKGEDITAIVAEKERLRNITNLADQATTLDQLRNIKVTS